MNYDYAIRNQQKLGEQQERLKKSLGASKFLWISLAIGFAFSNLLLSTKWSNWVEYRKQSRQRRASILCQLPFQMIGANLSDFSTVFLICFSSIDRRFSSRYKTSNKNGRLVIKGNDKKKNEMTRIPVFHCQFHDFCGQANWMTFSR